MPKSNWYNVVSQNNNSLDLDNTINENASRGWVLQQVVPVQDARWVNLIFRRALPDEEGRLTSDPHAFGEPT